jgi:predicted phage terminase large subunit-like protein
MELSQAQHSFRHSKALYRGFVGGRGAGKSFVGAYDLLCRSKPGRLYMVVAPSYTMLADSSFKSFLEVARKLGLAADRDIRKQPPRVRLRTGAEVLFRSADDPEKLRGPNLSGAWLDEASQVEQGAYDIVIACLREGGEQKWLSCTFTPKGKQHWTYLTFDSGRPDTELFRSRTRDNPFLPPGFHETLAKQYTSALAAQELGGEFCDAPGAMFARHWFRIVDAVMVANRRKVRCWDLAASDPKKGEDPDWTVGVLMGVTDDKGYAVLDVRRTRGTPAAVEALIKHTAEADGKEVTIWMEQEPGAAGVTVVDHYRREVLPGWRFMAERPTGEKAVRAQPLAAMAEGGGVMLVRAPWNKDFLDEFEVFPAGSHDDQVDATSAAFNKIAPKPYRFGFIAGV